MTRLSGGLLAAAVVGLTAAGAASGTQPAPSAAVSPQAPRPAASRAARPAPAPSHVPVGAAAPGMSVRQQNELVATYCVNCHNDKAKVGGQSFTGFDAARAVEQAPVVEKMIRKVRAGMMPPAGVKQPEPAARQAFLAALETRLDRAAQLNPNPGSRPFGRLNRAEYAAAVKALLGVDIDVSAYLPPDTISHSFDNIADAQPFSPALMDGYLRAAGQISRLAVGDPEAAPGSVTYKLIRDLSQMQRVDGAPFGTRGGISVVHTFPADGDYVFRLYMHYRPEGRLVGATTMASMNLAEEMEVSIDGARVALLPLNTRMAEGDREHPLELKTPPIHVRAGSHRVSAAFIQQIDGLVDDLLLPLGNSLADVDITFGVTLLPHLRDMTIVGPSRVTGVSESESRRRIFTCRPTAEADETTCAASIVERLASQAYRRPASARDVEDLMAFYHEGRKTDGFEGGVRMALQAILASPKFVLRMEQGPPPTLKAGQLYRISDVDLASRLSFFLWGTVPDADLMNAANAGKLATAAGLGVQVRRMLADPRSQALSTRFASQWLRLQDLSKIRPDYFIFPNYDGTLSDAMLKETQLFFEHLVREDRSVLEMLTADYSFVNERLARHYGLTGVRGSHFRRVQLPETRRGVLGHGSILTLTSLADRTSPVLRGKWIMEVLLGTPPPPPPPNVPDLDDSAKPVQGGKMLSTRERMEEHRKNPACSSCHRVIDPLGLALDNFDATGAWRIKDNQVPVDAAGDLYDGTKIDGPAGLRDALLRHRDIVLQTFTESLLTYALGRRVEYYDMPTVRRIVRDAAKNDYRISSFIKGVANSQAFRMGRVEAAAAETTAAGRQR